MDLSDIHKKLLARKDLANKTLAEFEKKLMAKLEINNSDIATPELFWRKCLDKSDDSTEKNEAKIHTDEELLRENFIKEMENNNTFHQSEPDEYLNNEKPKVHDLKTLKPSTSLESSGNNTEEYQNCMSYKMLSDSMNTHTKYKIEKLEDNKSASQSSSIKNDFIKNTEEGNELILIKSKRILIDLIDKEIELRYSNKKQLNSIQDESGGDSNKNYETEKLRNELKQKRLTSIANIKREIEMLEKLSVSEN